MATAGVLVQSIPQAPTLKDDEFNAVECEHKVFEGELKVEAKQQIEVDTQNCTDTAELNGADNPLSEVVRTQAERIKELEYSLADSRKIIRNREQLLTELQWKPKEDYYAWKNPTINDKNVKDVQERKMKVLLEQMRVMEKVLAEREQVLRNLLDGHSPKQSPARQSPHLSSPEASPSTSPTSSSGYSSGSAQSTPGEETKKSWWTLKRSGSVSSTKSSPGGTPTRLSPSSAVLRRSGSARTSPAVPVPVGRRAKDHIV